MEQDIHWLLTVIQLFSKFPFAMESEITTKPHHLAQYRAIIFITTTVLY